MVRVGALSTEISGEVSRGRPRSSENLVRCPQNLLIKPHLLKQKWYREGNKFRPRPREVYFIIIIFFFSLTVFWWEAFWKATETILKVKYMGRRLALGLALHSFTGPGRNLSCAFYFAGKRREKHDKLWWEESQREKLRLCRRPRLGKQQMLGPECGSRLTAKPLENKINFLSSLIMVM